jgi:hypothetical protein
MRLTQYCLPMLQVILYPADHIVKLHIDNLESAQSGYYMVSFEAKECRPIVSTHQILQQPFTQLNHHQILCILIRKDAQASSKTFEIADTSNLNWYISYKPFIIESYLTHILEWQGSFSSGKN